MSNNEDIPLAPNTHGPETADDIPSKVPKQPTERPKRLLTRQQTSDLSNVLCEIEAQDSIKDPVLKKNSKRGTILKKVKAAGNEERILGPRVIAIKGKRIMNTGRKAFIEYLVQWETSRGKLQWVSRKILANAEMCSTQANMFLANYEDKIHRRINRRKMEVKCQAATTIQKEVRRYIGCRKFKRIKFNVLRLQCICRRRYGRLEARRRRLLLERKRKKLEAINRNNDTQIGDGTYGNISAVLRDAYMAVCNEGKYSWHEKQNLMWKCLSCSFENESTSSICELCLRKPAVSNRLLQVGQQIRRKTFQPKKTVTVKRHTFFG